MVGTNTFGAYHFRACARFTVVVLTTVENPASRDGPPIELRI